MKLANEDLGYGMDYTPALWFDLEDVGRIEDRLRALGYDVVHDAGAPRRLRLRRVACRSGDTARTPDGGGQEPSPDPGAPSTRHHEAMPDGPLRTRGTGRNASTDCWWSVGGSGSPPPPTSTRCQRSCAGCTTGSGGTGVRRPRLGPSAPASRRERRHRRRLAQESSLFSSTTARGAQRSRLRLSARVRWRACWRWELHPLPNERSRWPLARRKGGRHAQVERTRRSTKRQAAGSGFGWRRDAM